MYQEWIYLTQLLIKRERNKTNKKYKYPGNNKVDRMNRTYIDYLAYKKSHINELGS